MALDSYKSDDVALNYTNYFNISFSIYLKNLPKRAEYT